MAIYRNVQMTFWTDSKVVDDFSPEDRYFYLYLLTNPHTNLCGCYEVSSKQMAIECGYKDDVVKKLLKRMQEEHKVSIYDSKTKELLLLNWSKFNWTSSEKFRKPLLKEIEKVKNADFKGYLMDLYNGIDTVSIPYTYGTDTTVSVTVTDTVSDTVSVTDKKKDKKDTYGENGLVKLTPEEYNKLVADFGPEDAAAAIAYLDDYISDKGYKSKSNYSAIRRWVISAVREKKRKAPQDSNMDDFFRRRIGG